MVAPQKTAHHEPRLHTKMVTEITKKLTGITIHFVLDFILVYLRRRYREKQIQLLQGTTHPRKDERYLQRTYTRNF